MTFKSVKSNNYVSVLTLSFDIWVDNMDMMGYFDNYHIVLRNNIHNVHPMGQTI